MTHYSIVIPTFGRNKFLKDCLKSVEQQLEKPQEVFIMANNTVLADQKSVESIVLGFSNSEISFNYRKGIVNSGAVARNYGATLVYTEIVAFLDDDVILENNYYDEIMKVFKSDDSIVGVQGLDTGFRDSYILNVKNKFMGTFWSNIENFFEHASIVRLKDSRLRPSLAVCHPTPDQVFTVESQWISTCAGAFKKEIFSFIEFPNQFVKYSWNEYVFFSHSIFQKNLGKMIYTSKAKYRNIPTDDGRMPITELVYMAEVYDLYIFYTLFNRNLSDRIIFLKSKIGRFLFYTAKALKRRNNNSAVLIELLRAFYFCFKNSTDIKNGNFTAYNEKFGIF